MAFAELTFPRFAGTPTYTTMLQVDVHQEEFNHDRLIVQAPPGEGYFALVDQAHLSGSPVQLEWGDGAENEFFLGYVDRVLPALGNGNVGLRIACVGASYPMKQARQQVWSQVSAPQVAASMAAFYGFATQIESHPRVYRMVSQAGESDWALLARLAREIGFTFYVRGTTLHFHSRQYRLAERRSNATRLNYNLQQYRPMAADSPGNLKSFQPSISEAGRHALVVAGVDPYLGYSHQAVDTGVTPELGNTIMEPIFNEYPLTTASTIAEATEQLAGEQENRRWHLTAKAEAAGGPALTTGSLIYLSNVPDTYLGYWWVIGAVHRLTGSPSVPNDPTLAYWTELTLGRDGMEQSADLAPNTVRQRYLHPELDAQGTVSDAPDASLLTESGQWVSVTLGQSQPYVEPTTPDYVKRRLQRVDG